MLFRSHTNWRFPFALVFAGEPANAVNVLKAHMRLDPFYEPNAPALIGFACYMLNRYAEAVPHLRESVSRAPNMRFAHSLLAATYARLDQPDNAKAAAAEVLRIDPSYTISWSPLAATFRPNFLLRTIRRSTKTTFTMRGAYCSRPLRSIPTTLGRMPPFLWAMCPLGFTVGMTIVPGLPPSTAPASQLRRPCGSLRACQRLILGSAGR